MTPVGRDRPSSWKSSLTVSSFLHLGIFVFILWPLARHVIDHATPPPLRIQLEVESKTPRATGVPERKRAPAPQPRAQRAREPVPLSQLGVKLFEPPPIPGDDSARTESKTASALSPGGAPDFARETRANPLYEYIHQRIDSQLPYPAELSSRGISGTVQTRLSFNRDGELLADATHYETSSRFLKVVVARAIRQAFRDPIPARKLGLNRAVVIDCAFRFQITEHDDEDLKKTFRLSLGKELAFYRNFQHSVLQWDLGPLHGLGPFAASLDPTWFVTEIAGLFDKKAKFDPLDSYREDPNW